MSGTRRLETTDAVDLVSHCASKIEFLSEFFSLNRPDHNFEISSRGIDGLLFILDDLSEELEFISTKMGEEMKNAQETAGDKNG